jgi:hypothetical protein
MKPRRNSRTRDFGTCEIQKPAKPPEQLRPVSGNAYASPITKSTLRAEPGPGDVDRLRSGIDRDHPGCDRRDELRPVAGPQAISSTVRPRKISGSQRSIRRRSACRSGFA